MQYDRDTVLGMKRALVTNNPATGLLLMMLPDDGPLPTLQRVEQEASKQLMESLTRLAKQCADAHFQPLEVFTRSTKCTAHMSGVESISIVETCDIRRQRRKQPSMTLGKGWSQKSAQGLQELGVPERMAQLIVTYLRLLILRKNAGNKTAMLAESEFNHMLPGRLPHSS